MDDSLVIFVATFGPVPALSGRGEETPRIPFEGENREARGS